MLSSTTRPPPKVLLTARTKVKDEPRVTDGLNVGAHHVLVNRISPDFQIWNKRRILHLPCPWWVGCEILPSAHPHLPYLWTRRNNGQGGGRRAPWYLTCSSKLWIWHYEFHYFAGGTFAYRVLYDNDTNEHTVKTRHDRRHNRHLSPSHPSVGRGRGCARYPMV